MILYEENAIPCLRQLDTACETEKASKLIPIVEADIENLAAFFELQYQTIKFFVDRSSEVDVS